jgi:hypothetical protein
MNDTLLHPLARDYLKRLKKTARDLPRARRAELLEEIEAHLREALPPGADEAEARDALERLGEPEQIVAEAAPVTVSGPRAGWQEWAAIPLLLVGGFLVVVGWLIGLVLLWSSRIWTIRDKLIGTLVLPGGLLPLVLLLTMSTGTCSGSSGTRINPKTGRAEPLTTSNCPHHSAVHTGLTIAMVIALFALPLLTSIYLARRADRAAAVA